MDRLPDMEQALARQLYRRRRVACFYRVFNGNLNKPHIAALRDPLRIGRQMLVDTVSKRWVGNIVPSKSIIMCAVSIGNIYLTSLACHACPVNLSKGELDEIARTEEQWARVGMQMAEWTAKTHNMNEEGWVSNGHYRKAKSQMEEVKKEVKAFIDGDEGDLEALRKGWPWRERDEVY